MVSPAWQGFLDEIQRWRDAGRTVDLWWRDDDASRPDPALDRLMSMADSLQVPLALAVIPHTVQADAFGAAGAMVTLLQHGVDHCSRAQAGAKKTEFPDTEPVDAALARLAQGRAQLQQAVGDRLLPVLVPPWNRISSPQLLDHLAAAGYRGLSTFGARGAHRQATGLTTVNTHVDIIDWHGTRGFAGEDFVLGQAMRHLQARRTGAADAAESTGWLTHHAVHDAACWAFMALLLQRTRDDPAVRWRSAPELFDIGVPS